MFHDICTKCFIGKPRYWLHSEDGRTFRMNLDNWFIFALAKDNHFQV